MRDKIKMNKGFTLIELIVVIAIFAIISSIIVFNYSDFNSSASIENLSQDIALSIRKAQVSAIGVLGVSAMGTPEFPGYGIHFQLSSNPIGAFGSEKSFIFFADLPPNSTMKGDKRYNQTTVTCEKSTFSITNECLDIIGITSANKISEICLNDNNSLCYSASSGSFPSLDIVFTRPNPEAEFYFCPPSAPCFTNISSVSIKIKSSITDKAKEITVRSTGQISVNSIISSSTPPTCVPPKILIGGVCTDPVYD